MNNIRKLALAALLLVSGGAVSAGLTDAEAHGQAVRLETTIVRARAHLNELIDAGERHRYRSRVRDSVQAALDAWPANEKALFPYYGCRMAAVGLLQYGDAWVRSDPSQHWRTHVIKTFRRDYQTCKASLKKPDLSLKNLQ